VLDRCGIQTLYVLFFIELRSRRVHFASITTNPCAGYLLIHQPFEKLKREFRWPIYFFSSPLYV